MGSLVYVSGIKSRLELVKPCVAIQKECTGRLIQDQLDTRLNIDSTLMLWMLTVEFYGSRTSCACGARTVAAVGWMRDRLEMGSHSRTFTGFHMGRGSAGCVAQPV